MTYKLITSKNVTNIFDGKSDRERGREDECMIRGNKKIQKETEDEKKLDDGKHGIIKSGAVVGSSSWYWEKNEMFT